MNEDPTSSDDSYTLRENDPVSTLNVLQNDSDYPDARETLSVASVTALICTDGRDNSVSASYATAVPATPSTSGVRFSTIMYFWGICTFDYTVSDGNGGSATASVKVTINNGNIGS